MNVNILSTSGKAFQKFISHLTQQLTKPKTKFITDLLCGMLFSSDLILTNIASKVPPDYFAYRYGGRKQRPGLAGTQ